MLDMAPFSSFRVTGAVGRALVRDGSPGGIGVVALHLAELLQRPIAQVLLVHDTLVAHDEGVDPGHQVLRRRGDQLLEWNVSQGPPPEPAESFDALVVFGGSMHVDQEDKHPWLPGQHNVLRGYLN